MIYEYAIDPELAAQSSNLQLLEPYFGFEYSRYISSFPKSWKKTVFEIAQSIGDMNQIKVTELLRILEIKRSWRNSGRAYNTEISWEANAHSASPTFHCIIHNKHVKISDISSNHEKFKTPIKWERKNKTLKNLQEIFSWIFQNSKDIYVIDPYFNPHNSKYQIFFKWILEILNARSDHNDIKLNICLSCRGDSRPFLLGEEEKAYSETMKQISGVFTNINFIIKDVNMHSRYIFSDDICFNSDHSFDINPSAIFSVYLNSWETINELKRDYFDQV